MDLLRDQFPCNQALNFTFEGSIISRFPDKTSDRIVAAAVCPIILRLSIRLCSEFAAAADYIPWTVYICISEPVAIIPLLHRAILFRQPILSQQFSYFLIGKTKIFIKIHIRNRQHAQIIQSGKDTFL